MTETMAEAQTDDIPFRNIPWNLAFLYKYCQNKEYSMRVTHLRFKKRCGMVSLAQSGRNLLSSQ